MTAAEQPVMPKQIARRRRHVTTAGRTTSLAAYYSSHAEAYEARWAAALVPASERLLTRLTLSTASRVLDLGAGVGTLVRRSGRWTDIQAHYAVHCHA